MMPKQGSGPTIFILIIISIVKFVNIITTSMIKSIATNQIYETFNVADK